LCGFQHVPFAPCLFIPYATYSSVSLSFTLFLFQSLWVFPDGRSGCLLYRTDLNFEKLADINECNVEISVNVCNMGRVMK
jgi:hypothetical protein